MGTVAAAGSDAVNKVDSIRRDDLDGVGDITLLDLHGLKGGLEGIGGNAVHVCQHGLGTSPTLVAIWVVVTVESASPLSWMVVAGAGVSSAAGASVGAGVSVSAGVSVGVGVSSASGASSGVFPAGVSVSDAAGASVGAGVCPAFVSSAGASASAGVSSCWTMAVIGSSLANAWAGTMLASMPDTQGGRQNALTLAFCFSHGFSSSL